MVFYMPKYAGEAATYMTCHWQLITDALATGRFSVFVNFSDFTFGFEVFFDFFKTFIAHIMFKFAGICLRNFF